VCGGTGRRRAQAHAAREVAAEARVQEQRVRWWQAEKAGCPPCLKAYVRAPSTRRLPSAQSVSHTAPQAACACFRESCPVRAGSAG